MIKNCFLFLILKIENTMFLDNIFSLFYVVFICFLSIVLENNYISM